MKTTTDLLREARPDMRPHILLGAYSALLDTLVTELRIARKYKHSRPSMKELQRIVNRSQELEALRKELK